MAFSSLVRITELESIYCIAFCTAVSEYLGILGVVQPSSIVVKTVKQMVQLYV